LILWRHAEAEAGGPDSARKLTEHGREQARRYRRLAKATLAWKLRNSGQPRARAQQTVRALGVAFMTTPAVGTMRPQRISLQRSIGPHARQYDRRTPADTRPRGRDLAFGAQADWDIGKGALWWIRHSGGEPVAAAIDPSLRIFCRSGRGLPQNRSADVPR